MSEYERAKIVADYIMSHSDIKPYAVLVLGSGLGSYGNRVKDPVSIPYDQIPGFCHSTVSGHAGRLILGELFGVPVAIMQGRIHFYEGYTAQDITLPIRALRLCGAEVLLLTNAAGGINLSFQPGDLMLIDDHINFAGQAPLVGPNADEFGTRFPDMSLAYDRHLKEILLDCANKAEIDLKRGVYMLFTGPQYETPAEIRFARIVGADAAGMSTVPEVIVGRHAGMRIAAISCITNMAAGILDQPLSHEEVKKTADQVEERFSALVDGFLRSLCKEIEEASRP